jgi:steroid delta-isomerase-like uncharacterized protein
MREVRRQVLNNACIGPRAASGSLRPAVWRTSTLIHIPRRERGFHHHNQEGISAMKQLIHAMPKAGSVVLLLVVFVATGFPQQQKLKPIVDKYVEIWNSGNVKDLDAIVDPHFVRHSNDQPVVEGVEGISKVISGFRSAYPDLKISVSEQIFVENKCVGRWMLTGTNTGSGEMPPTGKSVKTWGISMIHFADGKITEEWVAADNQSFMEQLGFTMTPPSEKKK